MPKLLLVEDNELNRDMLSRRLSRSGYSMCIAVDGRQGVELARSELPDLILMDMSLPVMDGWEATRQIRATPETHAIPIIALTAHAMAEDATRAREAGCNDYDTKPIDLERLLGKIAQLLELVDDLTPAADPSTTAAPPPSNPRSQVWERRDVAAPLPGPTSAPPAHSEPVERHPTPDTRHPTPAAASVLVVDDSEPNRDLLVRRLRRLGYEVAQAENGRQALERLRGQPFDLLLLDIMMPVMNGYEVLATLREDEALRHIPVIVLSALDEIASAVRCIEMGAEDYLPKPFDPVLLQARIGACLEKKRLRDREVAHLTTIEAQAAELSAWNRTLERRVASQVEEIGRLQRLRRFLSPQLAEVVASPGNERLLDSHRREITVVFCDLRGFTAFAESSEPEELMGVLHEYHTALGELIFQYEGTLERFTGDGMMVFFNDPVPCDDPAWRAVQMAVAMRERVGELQRRWRRLGYDLGFGIGVAAGYATCGRIGFEGRYDYGAIGTVTNVSARLCGEAAEGQILISGGIFTAIEDRIEAAEAGVLALKGFRRPVPAFNVLGLKPGSI